MVKCSKAEMRRLRSALRWKKIPAAQRQRDDAARNCGGDGYIAEHGEPRSHGL
jgi:hypothetical protein